MRLPKAVTALGVSALLAGGLAGPAEGHTLSYSKAKRAAQQRADAFAGQRADVHVLRREYRRRDFSRDPHRFSASARWEEVDPTGCKGCGVGYDPTTDTYFNIDTPSTMFCSADLAIVFRGHSRGTRRVVAQITDRACF